MTRRTPSEHAKVAKPRRGKHLTETQKAELITLWKAGAVTLEDLAKRYKSSTATIKRTISLAGAKKGEDAADARKQVEEKIRAAIIDDASIVAQRIHDTKEEHYKMSTGLAKLTWNLIAEARQNKVPMGALKNDMQALKSAADVLKITREERYTTLGIRDEEDLEDKPMPELKICELTAEDIKEMHKTQVQEDLGELDMELSDEAIVQFPNEDEASDVVIEE